MQVQEFNLFPTKILQVEVSDVINESDTQEIILTINDLIENHPDSLSSEGSIEIQSKTFLFDDQAPHVFQKLKKTFLKACEIYLKDNLSHYQYASSRAWFFKSDKSFNQPVSWHDHHPALLSGVFYVKSQGIGTMFDNPISTAIDKSPVVVDPEDISWIIFPSSLKHSHSQLENIDARYVIAADYFVLVN
jgi:hypothetical protein